MDTSQPKQATVDWTGDRRMAFVDALAAFIPTEHTKTLRTVQVDDDANTHHQWHADVGDD